MALNIVILAAGMGKRMQSDLPKVLHPIAGKPMLSHVIDTARKLQPNRIIVVVGHGAEIVKTHYAQDNDLGFALQMPQKGTAHAVQQAVDQLVGGDSPQDMTLILYGDVPLVQKETLQTLIQNARQGVGVLTEILTDPTGYGRIVRDTHGQINRIVEHKDASTEELQITEVNTGILCVPTALLKNWLTRIDNHNAQGEYYLTDIIGLAVQDQVTVNAAHPHAAWETLGVNSRIQQAQLERLWQAEQARRLLEQGVTLADPSHFDLRGELICGKDVFIDTGCIFEGKVVLADGVHIGAHCVLRDVSLGQGTRVEAFSHLEQASADDHAVIGPYARLRPATHLGSHSHVGNFVELKKTQLGAYSKANHLSYLGDATIGQYVNIGAGTITCNYDGVNKFQTIIEDGAFIGSDSQLIAPVKVGTNATLGAGTTLANDAPAEQLTISRVKQLTISHWKRPTKQKTS
ncbi:bifunctional UDP-N-acetylglucosamine diphosphorylase/glucosamine-1-phosphate N-acetyltransferase GlmU [Pelistega ratti]|uniref:bifunctional UDP-N-acetylglucosamine diphosphorylase/glucosamine-1-phosphate N-acetyltransferase GlmU n=1 Tax=Pelistega ratti TaxID=2652177 RepID=UPI001359B46A|nr:bifunctional UDP-N-acetylglucosamine diphosphorylase/glucosamine-1-phosphate N-acetyltransferase GlmU [Pelistega ratti]